MLEDTPDPSDPKFEAELEQLLQANNRPHGSGENTAKRKANKFLGRLAFRERRHANADRLTPYELEIVKAQVERIFAPEDEEVDDRSVGVSLVSGRINQTNNDVLWGVVQKEVDPDALSSRITLDVSPYKRGGGRQESQSITTYIFDESQHQLTVEKGTKHRPAAQRDKQEFLGYLQTITDIEPIQVALKMPYRPPTSY